jgi:hypothetical protein
MNNTTKICKFLLSLAVMGFGWLLKNKYNVDGGIIILYLIITTGVYGMGLKEGE